MHSSDEEMFDGERQDSDYDGAWKEALRFHLQEFIEKGFDRLAKLIDWTCEPRWLDKEISQIVGQSGRRNREVDVLFEAQMKSGETQWIMCHLEIQTSYDEDFVYRVNLYNSGLEFHFQRPVISLIILADVNPQWRPSKYHFELGGFESYKWFPICKVLDRLETDWLDDTSLVVQVARAQIAALRTTSDPEARYLAKTQLVRNLYTAGHTADTIRELFRLIDWMMHLRLDLSRKFEVELADYEKELQMPYVTSVERIAEERGIEKGIEKGREQGSSILVLKQLIRICGEVPKDIETSVRQLSLEQSQNLGEDLLNFKSLDDLRNWLNVSRG